MTGCVVYIWTEWTFVFPIRRFVSGNRLGWEFAFLDFDWDIMNDYVWMNFLNMKFYKKTMNDRTQAVKTNRVIKNCLTQKFTEPLESCSKLQVKWAQCNNGDQSTASPKNKWSFAVGWQNCFSLIPMFTSAVITQNDPDVYTPHWDTMINPQINPNKIKRETNSDSIFLWARHCWQEGCQKERYWSTM